MPAVKDALGSTHADAPLIRIKVIDAGQSARDQDFSQAHALLDETEALLSSMAGAPGTALAQPASDPAPALQEALGQWAQSRAGVISVLNQLETGIRGMDHALAGEAIILVKAIAEKLTATPDTRDSVLELRQYVATDEIIDDAELPNGFGFEVSIRAPLINALDALDRAFDA